MTDTTTTVLTAETGQQLAEHRINLGVSRRELSELSGITQSRVWRLEHVDTFESEADSNDVTNMLVTLQAWHQEHPEGKTKPARTKSTKSAKSNDDGARLAFLTDRVAQTISTIDTVTIPTLKAKKVSTVHLVELASHLRQLLEDAEKVTA